MTSIDVFLPRYTLETESLLTWYPTGSRADLTEAKIKGESFNHSNRDEAFESGVVVHPLAHMGKAVEGGLGPSIHVHAFIEIEVKLGLFEVGLELVLDRSRKKKRLVLRPDTRTAFMINLSADAETPVAQVKDTAAVLQVVFTAGPDTNPVEIHRVEEALTRIRDIAVALKR